MSFLSPCVLPLVPVLLSVVSGTEPLAAGEVRTGRARTVVPATAGFVLGFGLVFIGLGLTATTVGRALFHSRAVLARVSGIVVVAMALLMLATRFAGVSWFETERRLQPRLSKLGWAAPVVAGAAFGFGWTPCIGPVLTSVLALAAAQGHVARSVILMTAYTLGLGVPFLVSALAFHRLQGTFAWARRHNDKLLVASSLTLAFFGGLLAFNKMVLLTTTLRRVMTFIGLERLIRLG